MTLLEIQNAASEYKTYFEAGQVSKEEYISLLQGLECEKAIANSTEELQFKEQMNTYINATISAVSALA